MKLLYGLGKERLDKVRKLMDLGLDWQLHRCWLKETAAILNTTSSGLEGWRHRLLLGKIQIESIKIQSR